MAERVKIVFSKYDLDGNGDISLEELTKILLKLNPNFTADNCAKLFKDIDVNNDGAIQYSEWVDWLSSDDGENTGAKAGVMLTKAKDEMASASTVDTSRRQKLRGKFAKLDKNGNGSLDFQEIYSFFSKRYPNMTLPDLKVLYECADKSNDGALDFYELLDLLVTVPAVKADPDSAPKAASSLINEVMYRDDDAMMAEAWRKCEQDHKDVVSLTAELCGQLDNLEDQEKKHQAFRDAHAKFMRKHYAETGQLRG